jgi:nitrite reductase/ring-hydroxylating ferredoxin subunit
MTVLQDLVDQLGENQALEKPAEQVANLAGSLTSSPAVKNALSGTWLGHRLHPLLTDVAIGTYMSASILDVVGGKTSRKGAERLIELGLLSTLPTAAAGLSDWSDSFGESRRIGLVHAGANVFAMGLYATSLLARKRGKRFRGKLLSLAGLGVLSASGYLGGHLSFVMGEGVNHIAFEEGISDWTDAVHTNELEEGKPRSAKVGDVNVFLLKRGGSVVAMNNSCNHAGGPLAEGELDGACVTCPWHGSVFRIDDGSVVRGPAAIPQPVYDVRVESDGMVQVRSR